MVVSGYLHHVTQRRVHSMDVFHSDVDRREYERMLSDEIALSGVVTVAWEYPWSSTRFHVGIVERDSLVTDRALLGLIMNWRGFLCYGAD